MTTITVRQNGPLRVEGDDVTLVDWNGQEYRIEKRPFVLCRCGHSSKKPFCDGTHRTIGFQGGDPAAPEAPPAPPASEAE
jgi:CDGSH-type Zn-finger protein